MLAWRKTTTGLICQIFCSAVRLSTVVVHEITTLDNDIMTLDASLLGVRIDHVILHTEIYHPVYDDAVRSIRLFTGPCLLPSYSSHAACDMEIHTHRQTNERTNKQTQIKSAKNAGKHSPRVRITCPLCWDVVVETLPPHPPSCRLPAFS